MTIIFEFTIGHLKCLPFTETCITVSSMICSHQISPCQRFFKWELTQRTCLCPFLEKKKKTKQNKTNTTSLGVVSFPRQIWFLHLQSHTDVFLFHTRSFVHRYVKLSLNEEQQKHCHLLDECGFAVSQQTIPTINSTQTTETLHLQAILITGYKRKKISLCRDSLWETPEWHTTKIKNTYRKLEMRDVKWPQSRIFL